MSTLEPRNDLTGGEPRLRVLLEISMRPTEHARTIPSPPPFLPPLLRAPGVVRTGVTAAAPSCQEIRLRCSSRFNGFNRRRFCGAVCLKTITALFPEATGVGYPFLLQ